MPSPARAIAALRIPELARTFLLMLLPRPGRLDRILDRIEGAGEPPGSPPPGPGAPTRGPA